MAVTLYRCSKCRGLFNAVFEPFKMCRDCKLGQSIGGTSKASLSTLTNPTNIVDDDEEINIVEPEGSMGGNPLGKAIGGSIGDAQNVFAQQGQQQAYQQAQQNWAGKTDSLMGGLSAQGIYSGGSEIRSPFRYSEPAGNKFYDPVKDCFWERQSDGTAIKISPDGVVLGRFTFLEKAPSLEPPPKPEPETSVHDAILKPSRKLKLAAE